MQTTRREMPSTYAPSAIRAAEGNHMETVDQRCHIENVMVDFMLG